ncbi:MAG: DmsC/YnfH family molybdoenzyme membrane anchor subunit [Verrucomicrobiota bacterium]
METLTPHVSLPSLASLTDEVNLIDRFLAEQAQLTTAVTRFSQWHEQSPHSLSSKKLYQELIPLEQPKKGEQYGFQVDLDVCSGCKACVTACHSLNGLDDDEIWRNVGTLHGRNDHALQQTVTTACHHCLDPACSNGCPVLAYEKEEETGIVRHLDDQCIGCQYCILKCPYDVPKYNEKRGIVRKCDMCHSRLLVGEAPACVQACPNEAIKIVKIQHSAILELSTHPLVPGAHDSSYTLPSTQYLSKKTQDLEPADATAFKIESPHSPLVFMLVFTQAACGGFWANGVHFFTTGEFSRGLSFLSLFLLLVGLFSSSLHLGRPLHAWKSFLGWRKSWLSREVLAFGGWLLCALVSCVLPEIVTFFSLTPFTQFSITTMNLGTALLAVFCSIMVYADTPRLFWTFHRTAGKFLGTSLILGAALAMIFIPKNFFLSLAVSVAVLKLAMEAGFVRRHLSEESSHPHTQSARVVWVLLKPLFLIRLGITLLGLLVLGIEPISATFFLLIGELLERRLFFQSVRAPRMPGNF